MTINNGDVTAKFITTNDLLEEANQSLFLIEEGIEGIGRQLDSFSAPNRRDAEIIALLKELIRLVEPISQRYYRGRDRVKEVPL